MQPDLLDILQGIKKHIADLSEEVDFVIAQLNGPVDATTSTENDGGAEGETDQDEVTE